MSTAVHAPAATSGPVDPEGRGLDASGRLARLPALDGIRGLGIPFVLLYHHGMPLLGIRFGGGFLTVSMFFTLSGFLITRLLVQEHDRTGRIALGTFYTRRIRRLMPAALTVTLLVAVFWTVFPGGTRSLPFSSFFWALFYGTNILLIQSGNSYQDLFADRSPLQHTWSLSLEEQIYIVFPLVLILLLRSTAVRRHAALGLTTLAGLGFGAAWYWAVTGGNDRAYYATEARAGEFLVGAALAVFWSRSRLVPALSRWIRSRAGAIVGMALLVLEVWLWWVVDLGSPRLFRGATILNSLVVAALMAYACALPAAGPSRLLTNRRLVALGQRAYVVYLVHWPVFVFIDTNTADLSSAPLLLLRLAVTFSVSESIFRWIENPVLRSQLWPGTRLYRGCALLAVAGLAIAPFAPEAAADRLVDPEALRLQEEALASLPQFSDADPTRSSVDPDLPARVLVVGDSQSWMIGLGMKDFWGVDLGVRVEPSAGVGCGVSEITPMRYLGEDLPDGRSGCREWRAALPRILDRYRPQVVVVIGGLADLADREIGGRWQHIGEAEYDEWLHRQMVSFADEMHATGARVLWLTHPDIDVPNPPGVDAYPEEDPARMARYNDLIEQVADELDHVATDDLATFVRQRPGGQFDPEFRPDGSHMFLSVAPDVVDFIGAAIRRTAGTTE